MVPCQVVNAVSVFCFPSTFLPDVLVQVNRVLYLDDPNQTETLLCPSQLMHFGVRIDTTPSVYHQRDGKAGTQGMTLLQDSTTYDFPFSFDGSQLFIAHCLPTNSDFLKAEPLQLTSLTNSGALGNPS